MTTIRPGQVWEEVHPVEGAEPECIVLYGVAQGRAYYVSADPEKPAEERSCSLFAFWPEDAKDRFGGMKAHEMGRYRMISDAENSLMARSSTVLSTEYVRAWAAEVLAARKAAGSANYGLAKLLLRLGEPPVEK